MNTEKLALIIAILVYGVMPATLIMYFLFAKLRIDRNRKLAPTMTALLPDQPRYDLNSSLLVDWDGPSRVYICSFEDGLYGIRRMDRNGCPLDGLENGYDGLTEEELNMMIIRNPYKTR